MISNETWCTQPSLGKGEVVSSILTGSTRYAPLCGFRAGLSAIRQGEIRSFARRTFGRACVSASITHQWGTVFRAKLANLHVLFLVP